MADPVKTAVLQNSPGIALDGQFTVLPGKNIEDLSYKTVQAYEAADLRNNGRAVFSYVADRLVPMRFRTLSNLKNLKCPYLVRPLHWQMAKIAHQPSQLYVVCNAPGAPLFNGREASDAIRWNEATLRDVVLRPAVSALLDLQSIGFPHRAIAPNNIFFTDSQCNTIMLGECFMSPPGWRVPPAYETIDMGATEALAKGEGSFSNDLYTLGVIALQLLTGQDYSAPALQHEWLGRKINQGSFAALSGSYRFQPNLTEFLKGVLQDDVDYRWTLNEVDSWLNGHKIVPRQGKTPKRAGRGFFYSGKEHVTLASIVYAMGREHGASVETLQNPSFENWLKRSMNAEDLSEGLKIALSNAKRSGENPNIISCYGLTALCPGAPLFYQGNGLHPEGMGPLFIAAGVDPVKRQMCVDLLKHRLATNWLKAQPKLPPEWMRLNKLLEKLNSFLNNVMYGYGYERCLYELNPDTVCLSPILSDHLVKDPSELLPALEKNAQNNVRSGTLIDRHIAAFLAAHSGYVTDEQLFLLNDSKHPWLGGVAALKILHTVNLKNGNREYPALCLSLQHILQPAIDSYYNEKRREKIKNSLSDACRSGRIADVLAIVDDNEERKDDLLEFARARKQFVELGAMNKKLKADITQLDKSAQGRVDRIGPYVAAAVGLVVLGLQV